MGPIGCPETSVTTNLRCLIYHMSEDLSIGLRHMKGAVERSVAVRFLFLTRTPPLFLSRPSPLTDM